MNIELKPGKSHRTRKTFNMIRLDPPEELRSSLPTARTLQMPTDPFGAYAGDLYPLPGGLKYSQLLQCIATNPTLYASIATRAALTAMGGAEVVKTPGTETADLANRQRAEAFISDQHRWRAGAGVFGMGNVLEQVVWDHLGFGCGHAEALPPTSGKTAYRNGVIDPRNPRIVGLAHLPRLNVRLIRPKTQTSRIGWSGISKIDANDLLYPQLLYCQAEIDNAGSYSTAVGYTCRLKAFGDPRIINAATGKEDDATPPELQATEYLRWRTYFPGYEEGWPEFASGLENVNQVDSISRYYTHLFRRNAIPDLIMIIRNAKVRDTYGSEAEEKFRSIRQRREHNENYTAVAIFDFPAVKNERTGEVIKVEVEIHKLNPLEGPVVQAVLEMEERADRKIAMALRMPAQLINYPTRGGLGGGSEFRAVVKMLSQLVIVPDQQKLHGLLDQVTTAGLGIPDWRIRLIPPDYNDPEVEAKIYQTIDSMKSLMVGEKRAYMGYGSLREILEQAQVDAQSADAETSTFDPDHVFVMGPGDQLASLADLQLLAGSLQSPETGGLPEGDERARAKQELEALVSGMDGEDVAAVFDQVVERSRQAIEQAGASWRPEAYRSHEDLAGVDI